MALQKFENQNSIELLFKELSDVVEATVKAKLPSSPKGEKVNLREGLNISTEVFDLRKIPSLDTLGKDFLSCDADQIVDILVDNDVLLHEHNASNRHFAKAIQHLAFGIMARMEGR